MVGLGWVGLGWEGERGKRKGERGKGGGGRGLMIRIFEFKPFNLKERENLLFSVI
jgi:hypothetical protein